MVTSDERMKILQMLRDGRISPDEAAQLLEALDVEVLEPTAAAAAAETARASTRSTHRAGFPEPEPIPEGRKARWLRVRVTDTDSGKPRVNLRMPVSLVNLGVKLGSRFSPEIEGVDMAALLTAVQMGEPGPFVDVYDDEDGEHVEIFLE